MISVQEALEAVLALFGPLEAETVSLREAAGRVLAEPAVARRDQPPFASSAMDGYAVQAGDIQPGAVLTVIGESAAGARFDGAVAGGQAVRIFTGAPVPPGGDRILIQEDCTRDGDRIMVGDDLDTAAYVRPAGGDFRKGDAIDPPRLLTPEDVALLAAMNCDTVRVRRKPVVALIATGDELVMPGEAPGPDQIISSNNLGLAALVESVGGIARVLPIAADTHSALEGVFALGQSADVIVTLGGASVGDRDLVRQVAGKAGLDQAFYKVAMRPGKPLMAGRLGDTPMIGLPGNPVSSMVCGHVFLRPALNLMLGLPGGPLPRERMVLGRDIGANGPREHYMRARVTLRDGVPTCWPEERQDSSLLSVLARSDALMVRPVADAAKSAGAEVEVIRL